MTYNEIIFGSDPTENIVSCEVNDSSIEIFKEVNGIVSSQFIPNKYWICAAKPYDKQFQKLDGNLYYKYIRFFDSIEEYKEVRSQLYNADTYCVFDDKEMAMILNGFTYFKGSKISDVSTLAFDIESTGLNHDKDAKVLLIANTFRSQGKIIRRLFSYSDYETEAEMFDDWCSWVREINPSILLGHNIVLYDLPYMIYCAEKAGTTLRLGRDGSDIQVAKKESKFRKDGSQFYAYKRCKVYGREIIDTFFLALKYDVGRKYDSYKLKTIIKYENLEVKDRQFYDADQIRYNYKDPVEWEKIKIYAINDGDDALALYDLMAPSFFYWTRSIPKSFQSIIEGATGSQINSLMVRSYLQINHSLPKASDQTGFEGAISIGNPGIYSNVFKIDVASLYPSIMIQYNVYNKVKDPKGHFQVFINHFTEQRLTNKRLAKETGEKYYKDLEQSEKIAINSGYGFMGAPGVLFNSPADAAFITRKGREILTTSIEWAKENDFTIVNADTDSISITHNDGGPLSSEERATILGMINSMYPERIRFEDDGYYKSVLVLKAKNYALLSEDGKIKIKGSALKATTKEKALQEFIQVVIKSILHGEQNKVLDIYNSYVKEIINLKDISRWSSKKTVTDKVLNPERTNEQKVLDAIEGSEYVEGDKIRTYFDKDKKLKLEEHWNNDHDVDSLLLKVYNTIEVFETVLNMEQFLNYKLKRNKAKLEEFYGS